MGKKLEPETEEVQQKANKKRKIKETEEPVEKSIGDDQVQKENVGSEQVKEKGNKKRKVKEAEPENEESVEAIAPKKIKKNKEKKPTDDNDDKQKKVESVPQNNYQAGGLSSLFGKSTDGVVLQEKVTSGETVIKKTDKKANSDEKDGVEDSEESSSQQEAKSPKEGDFDRKQQRDKKKTMKVLAKVREADTLKTIFVGNMPLTMNEKAVRRIFSEYGKVDSVRMRSLIPSNGKLTKRLAHFTGKLSDKQTSLTFYVKFDNEESVVKALAYNGTKIDTHTIRVDRCGEKKSYDKNTAVFVGNLPFDISDDTLFQLFEKEIGPVDSVRIVRDAQTGNSKGFSFVNFKSEATVLLALGMETIKLGKRDLRITKLMKKNQISKVTNAKKSAGKQKKPAAEKVSEKVAQHKFSTRESRPRTDEQKERRLLKKSAKKAIKKKLAAKKGRIMK
ncbi:unnamed protein product [Caenorhabditis auriculariae]|uniref:RRM domain-containing protein n=1 Tax=Caenorhabditis auriculariae TaxID=2777116 RepID=A0A8S1HWK0_9PELO|nr:unnamed protein product [Caenorhabditis auriculariae]